jgi:hypothetical protein
MRNMAKTAQGYIFTMKIIDVAIEEKKIYWPQRQAKSVDKHCL